MGVNVHSGTANAGHYWSYINTNRGFDEKPDDDSWIKTETDPWMEFNDSRVSDFEFKDMRQRTFGTEKGANTGAYFSSLGDSYGTSAYMLFYERRQKKELKILVEESQVAEFTAKGANVEFDGEKKEHFKMTKYRTAADGELANDIYKKVAEDNMKFTFESDIYSTEFFDFILQILQSVAEGNVDDETKLNGMKIGTKVGFEILARMMINPGVDRLSQVMIDILNSRPDVVKAFIGKMAEFPDSQTLWEVLFDCNDKNAQKCLSRVIKFALCKLKEIEKDVALSGATERVTIKFFDSDGNLVSQEIEQPKATCIRFVTLMTEQLTERAPKAWRKFDSFLEIFFSFMVHSADDIVKENTAFDNTSEAYKTGVELYFRFNMIRYLGDFIL